MIVGKSSDYKTFSLNTFNDGTLYVPVGTIDKYKATEGWMDFMFIEEGLPNGVGDLNQAKAHPVLIQRDGNTMTISGALAGTPISVYDLSGRQIISATAAEGVTRVAYDNSDKVVIVKVGDKTVKVAQ